MATDLLSE